jgi:hypothetical protein
LRFGISSATAGMTHHRQAGIRRKARMGSSPALSRCDSAIQWNHYGKMATFKAARGPNCEVNRHGNPGYCSSQPAKKLGVTATI